MAVVAGISPEGTDRLRRGRTTAVMATPAAPMTAATLRASRRPPLKVSRPATWPCIWLVMTAVMTASPIAPNRLGHVDEPAGDTRMFSFDAAHRGDQRPGQQDEAAKAEPPSGAPTTTPSPGVTAPSPGVEAGRGPRRL
jgi:hypothetical protein